MSEPGAQEHREVNWSEHGMSNFDRSVDDGLESDLRAGMRGRHSAWNFAGEVWYDEAAGVFREEVRVNRVSRGERSAATLRDLMRVVNDEFGWDLAGPPGTIRRNPPMITWTPLRVQVTGDLYHGQVPAVAIYVGRPAPGLRGSKYANPFGLKRKFPRSHPLRAILDAAVAEVTGIDTSAARQPYYNVIIPATPAVACAAYRRWLPTRPDLIAAARGELAGRDLACWCKLPGRGEPDHCHARVLMDVANSPEA